MKNYRTRLSFLPMRKIRLWIIASLLLTAGMFLLFMSRTMENMREQQRLESNKRKLPWDTLKYYHTQHKRPLASHNKVVIPVPNGESKVREKARPLAPPVLVKPNNVLNFRQQILPPDFNSFKKSSVHEKQKKLQDLHQYQKLDKKAGMHNVRKNIQKRPKAMAVKQQRLQNNKNQMVFHVTSANLLPKNKQMVRFPDVKFSAKNAKMVFRPNKKANLRQIPNPRLSASNINVLHAPNVRQHAMNGKFIRYPNSRSVRIKGDMARVAPHAPNVNAAVLNANMGHGSIGRAHGNARQANIEYLPNARKGNLANVQNARISARKVVFNNLSKSGAVSVSDSGITILKRDGNSWINAGDLCQNTLSKLETIAIPSPLGNILIHGSKTETFESESAVEHYEMGILSGFQKTVMDNPNSLVIDIGSGYGVYSIMAARMGHLVVAVEPNLSAIPGLCATVKFANYSQGVIITHLKSNSNMKIQPLIEGDPSSQVCSNYMDLDALTEINSLHTHEDAIIRISPWINNAEEIILCLNKLVVLLNIKAVSMPWIKTSRRDAENILKLFSRLKMSPHEPDTQQEMLRSSDMSQWPSIVIWKSD